MWRKSHHHRLGDDQALGHAQGWNVVATMRTPRDGILPRSERLCVLPLDVTVGHKGNYEASAVGEVNVVELMKKNNAIIGGEGNGGIIYPESHYGRDSLVGVALFLTHLANKKMSVSALRASYPEYYMSKNKIELTPQIDVDAILIAMTEKYKNEDITTIDGVKIDFASEWVHLRKSNTEPIIRIYTEAPSQEKADVLALRIIDEIKVIAGI